MGQITVTKGGSDAEYASLKAEHIKYVTEVGAAWTIEGHIGRIRVRWDGGRLCQANNR